MWTRPGLRAHTAPVFLFAGIIAVGGCGAASPSPTPGDPTPTAPGLAATPTQSKEPSTPVTPIPPEPTPAPSSADVADSWIRLDDMSVPRESLEALELLDGRVFVIDATYNVISDLGGPPNDPGPTDILDPATGRWTPADPLNAPRSEFVAVRLGDGRVLVTGGDNGLYGAYSSTKLFNPATGRWTTTGLLNTARIGPAGALLADGRVLVAGGTYADGYKGEEDYFSERTLDERELTSAELFDPKTGRWSKTGGLYDAGSAGIAFTLPDGRVLAVGEWGRGLQGDDGHQDPAEIYDPIAGTWAVAGKVNWLNASVPVLLADGSLLLIGGATGEDKNRAVATVRRFDPGSGATSVVAPLPAPRMWAVAARLADGRVLVAGGYERLWLESGHLAPPTATAFLYDPALDRWTETAPMPFADSPGQALLLSDGSVLVVGGSIPNHDAETQTDTSSSNPVGWTARFRLGSGTGG